MSHCASGAVPSDEGVGIERHDVQHSGAPVHGHVEREGEAPNSAVGHDDMENNEHGEVQEHAADGTELVGEATGYETKHIWLLTSEIPRVFLQAAHVLY